MWIWERLLSWGRHLEAHTFSMTHIEPKFSKVCCFYAYNVAKHHILVFDNITERKPRLKTTSCVDFHNRCVRTSISIGFVDCFKRLIACFGRSSETAVATFNFPGLSCPSKPSLLHVSRIHTPVVVNQGQHGELMAQDGAVRYLDYFGFTLTSMCLSTVYVCILSTFSSSEKKNHKQKWDSSPRPLQC